MERRLDLGPVTSDERGEVVALVAAAQDDPSRHIAYLSLGPEPVAAELAALEPDGWAGVLAARRGGRIVGVLGAEHDREPPRVWWFGPVVAEDEAFGEVAHELLTAARAQLPAHVTEEELAGDDRNRDLATFASGVGFVSCAASAVLHRRAAEPPDVPDAGVRPFGDADRPAVAAIHDEAFPHAHLPGRRVDEGDARFVLVVERAGAVVGYVAAEEHADGSGYLDLVGVRPDQRRAGLGAVLVVAALRELDARGCAVVNLTVRETNLGARRLYERLGFVEERLVRPYRRGFALV